MPAQDSVQDGLQLAKLEFGADPTGCILPREFDEERHVPDLFAVAEFAFNCGIQTPRVIRGDHNRGRVELPGAAHGVEELTDQAEIGEVIAVAFDVV